VCLFFIVHPSLPPTTASARNPPAPRLVGAKTAPGLMIV
jgi:hypothetical protein